MVLATACALPRRCFTFSFSGCSLFTSRNKPKKDNLIRTCGQRLCEALIQFRILQHPCATFFLIDLATRLTHELMMIMACLVAASLLLCLHHCRFNLLRIPTCLALLVFISRLHAQSSPEMDTILLLRMMSWHAIVQHTLS
jgi:hypothetical protein